ncbi:MAG: 1-acyl-sn-glycerol-3-phosphate acyltransferase, partial [Cyanobacteria bacterium J06560_2]
LYREFETGKTRLLLAFRHPSITDPYMLCHLLWRAVPQTALELGMPLGPTHSHFIYDRGIPLWGGRWLGWLFARLGGVPIQRGKLDLLALKTARHLLTEGRFPLAAAPEGGTNGHNEIVSPLEPGIAQLAFWCADDLKSQDRDESVVILPIGIQYRYVNEPWEPLSQLIGQLEIDTGLGSPDDLARDDLDLYGRLYRLAAHLLTLMEGYYQEFYGVSFGEGEESLAENERLAARLQFLMNESLQVAEQYFGLRPKGSVIDRCRKLEQAGWDRIFREETAGLSSVELGLANRVAEEANLRMWHMRLVESFVAVTGRYVKEQPSADRFAETTLLLRNMVDKIKGETVKYPQLGKQRAIVTVGEPIRVDSRLESYKKKRRGAIATLTADLQTAMESLIVSE